MHIFLCSDHNSERVNSSKTSYLHSHNVHFHVIYTVYFQSYQLSSISVVCFYISFEFLVFTPFFMVTGQFAFSAVGYCDR